MTNNTDIVHDPFIKILRQVFSFIILFISIPIAVFVTVNITVPESPTVRLNHTLAHVYMNTNNWNLRHYIERTIDQNEIEYNLLILYRNQIWQNYLENPMEYVFFSSDRSGFNRPHADSGEIIH